MPEMGLPHVHILLWLNDKIKSADIDKVVNVKIHDHELHSALYKITKATKVHGPCGSYNRSSSFMVNDVCSTCYTGHLIKETQI